MCIRDSAFPFRPSWVGKDVYYISDGLIRRRSGARLATIPFSARLEAIKPAYTRATRDFTSTAPRRVLGLSLIHI